MGSANIFQKCARRTLCVISSTRTAFMGHEPAELPSSLVVPRRGHKPTPEEIAIAQAKKAGRLKEKRAKEKAPDLIAPLTIIRRPWLMVPTKDTIEDKLTLKVFTWNLLAQTLVRRVLFPESDCLKASQREKMLRDELLSQDASILCLQEVDRLEKVLPILDQAGYSHRYAAGRGKKHGCLIAFKRNLLEQSHERVVFYDEQFVRDAEDERARCGHSYKTTNIGLILALRFRDDPTNGVVVATTHLFWHPKYTYERSRQAGILVREVLDLRKTQNAENWPCFIAGDFNCPPDDATYSLLTNQPLTAVHADRLSLSRVTHISVDPTVSGITKTATGDEEEGGEAESDPDRIITNARAATQADGLLDDKELFALFAPGHPLESAYDKGLSQVQDHNIALFGARASLQRTQPGFHEPAYTSYTHFWKSVLDYIFFIPPQNRTCQVTSLLTPHRTEDFGLGLPMKGVCASDHVSLAAEFSWIKSACINDSVSTDQHDTGHVDIVSNPK